MKVQEFVLTLYPTSRGYAYVLFEGPESPFDWGTKDVRDVPKNPVIIDQVARLLERYHPTVLVMEEFDGRRSRRSERSRKLSRAIVCLATNCQTDVRILPRQTVKDCFSAAGAKTKYEIAMVVAQYIPAFKHCLPPLRKIWMSEDQRQSLFDAAALGITHYATKPPSD